MTPADIQVLVDYNYWARDRLLAAVEPLAAEQLARDMSSSFHSIRDTLAHIYGAEWVWLARWQGESPSTLPAADAFGDLASLGAAWSDVETRFRAFTSSLDDEGLARTLAYTLISGQSSAAPFWQMIQHVVNHGTYHRGQVVTMLRQQGLAGPQALDLIAFYRERAAAAPGR